MRSIYLLWQELVIQLKWLELQLSYKQGTCNLMNTSGVGKVTSRNIQFSVFMPIFK